MYLRNGGITIEVIYPADVDRLKRAGYTQVPETPEPPASTGPVLPTIAEIYALCEEAGVNPGDLRIQGDAPSLDDVIAAIAAAKGR